MKRGLVRMLAFCGLLLSTLFGVGLALAPARFPLPAVHAALPANPGPDLVVESITITPAVPNAGSDAEIKVIVRNRGTANAGGFYIHLYVDPRDRPPLFTTPDTAWTRSIPLSAGGRYTWSVTDQFFAPAGAHVVYVWVDRESEVIEDDETNNVSSKVVWVGTTPTPTSLPTATPTATPTPCVGDGQEPDNSCSTARAMTPDGTHGLHNLCPAGDEDWVRFSARAGITYTIETTAVGPDGDTALTLFGTCIGPPIATDDPPDATVARIVWPCTTSGDYHVRVRHHSASYGAASSYELSITPSMYCPEDAYERDDSCSAARDIVTNGTPEKRIFCAAQDHDWVKFNATSGSTIVIRTENLGAKADPVLSIFDSCNVPLSVGHAQQLEWIAPSDEIYYVEIQNHHPEVYGATTNYDLSVTTLGCNGDAYEFETGDDNASQARLILPNADAVTHNICPAGDEDWVKFAATQGLQYVIETFNLGLDADTQLCLYGPDGATEIACDDDGTGTKAARIVWTSPQSDTYYVRVRHYLSTVSGPNTGYDLRVTVGFHKDGFEPDNGYRSASPIGSTGVTQTHNFTPAQDEDWIKFNAVAGTYTIRTGNLAPGCDTVLQLYGPDGKTLLAASDDFSYGLGSQITYTILSAGTYYARTQNFRESRFGTNMRYDLLVVNGTPPPLPSPTPFPTPAGSLKPPPSAVKTLILLNRERIQTLYGPEKATQLMGKLYALASHPRVLGNVVQVETDAAVAAAYSAWNADRLSTAKANAAADTVRNLALSYLDVNPNVEYVVIIGNDEVIPFWRTLDRTGHPESRYAVYVTNATTVRAACDNDMTLTDNYYADREPTDLAGQELYIPDFAIGRLVETPDEIMGAIDLFLGGSTLQADRALVTGYDFIKDVGAQICSKLSADLGSANASCELIGEEWNGGQLQQKQLNTTPRFDLQSINGHANRTTEGAPKNPYVLADVIATYGSSDLKRALIYTLGCHSGLNDVGALPGGLDLAQAFAQRGALYVANTGYGWGLGDSVGLSEQLMLNFTQELLKGGFAIVGKALTTAKQRYFAEAPALDEYDEKILSESTLYGLPMYEVFTGSTLDAEIFPSVDITSALALPAEGLTQRRVGLGLAHSFASLEKTDTALGSYFNLDGHLDTGAEQPIQPKFYANVAVPDAGQAHGVVITGGRYTDTTTFNPVISQPVNEYITSIAEPTFEAIGWYPPAQAVLRSSATVSGTPTLVASMGQYSSAGGRERIFDRLSFDIYYSDVSDWWEPLILSVDGELSGAKARIKVEAADASGIHRVVVAYTDGSGTQTSKDLAFDSQTLKWTGEIPATLQTTFSVQVVDKAGNVATANNKGIGYNLERVQAIQGKTRLPLISSGR